MSGGRSCEQIASFSVMPLEGMNIRNGVSKRNNYGMGRVGV